MTIKNGDMPAMPVNQYKRSGELEVSEPVSAGMTKREMMAMHMMASNRSRGSDYMSWVDMAKDAIEMTDALLAELELTNG